MRYQRRGINENGQVANFVETEQVVIFKVKITSLTFIKMSYLCMQMCSEIKQIMLHLLFKPVDQVSKQQTDKENQVKINLDFMQKFHYFGLNPLIVYILYQPWKELKLKTKLHFINILRLKKSYMVVKSSLI